MILLLEGELAMGHPPVSCGRVVVSGRKITGMMAELLSGGTGGEVSWSVIMMKVMLVTVMFMIMAQKFC